MLVYGFVEYISLYLFAVLSTSMNPVHDNVHVHANLMRFEYKFNIQYFTIKLMLMYVRKDVLLQHLI